VWISLGYSILLEKEKEKQNDTKCLKNLIKGDIEVLSLIGSVVKALQYFKELVP